MHAIIFDLDQTLIDSKFLEPLREERRWPTIYAKIPQIKKFDGIEQIFTYLRETNIPMALVSSSPKPYMTKICQHFGWEFDCMVGYHDTTRHKPDPEPLLYAVRSLGVSPSECWSVGDSPSDVTASKRARMTAVAAQWGASELVELERAKPDFRARNPGDILTLLKKNEHSSNMDIR